MWMPSMYRVMQAEATKICGHVARVVCSKKKDSSCGSSLDKSLDHLEVR